MYSGVAASTSEALLRHDRSDDYSETNHHGFRSIELSSAQAVLPLPPLSCALC